MRNIDKIKCLLIDFEQNEKTLDEAANEILRSEYCRSSGLTRMKFQTMEKAYRKKILQQAEKAAIDGNTLLADGLKLLVKIYNEIDECREIEKKVAKKADYEGAIKLQGMVDAWKKTAWELQKVLNLR